MSREIERALAFFRRRRRRARKPVRAAGAGGERPSLPETVDLRLTNLERQLDEVRGRINGLLFLLAGAIATQVILRLFG